MIRRLLASTRFCKSKEPYGQALTSIVAKMERGERLHDYEYARVIEGELDKKSLRQAYNLLLHSQLSGVVLDKQIFNKVSEGIVSWDPSYSIVLSSLYSEQFRSKDQTKQSVQGSHSKDSSFSHPNKQSQQKAFKPEQIQSKEFQNKLKTIIRMMSKKDQIVDPKSVNIMGAVGVHKVNFKNVTINFDYKWLNDFSGDFVGSDIQDKQESQGEQNVRLSQSQGLSEEESDQDDEFTIDSMLRSIKSIEIGEMEISLNTIDK